MKKKKCENCTWADLRSIFLNANYKENMTIFSFCKIAENGSFMWCQRSSANEQGWLKSIF